jgi:hypothetical protein
MQDRAMAGTTPAAKGEPVRRLKNLQWAIAALAAAGVLVDALTGYPWQTNTRTALLLLVATVLLEAGTAVGLVLAAAFNAWEVATIALLVVEWIGAGAHALAADARATLVSAAFALAGAALQVAWWRVALGHWPALRSHFLPGAAGGRPSAAVWRRLLAGALALQWLALLALVGGALGARQAGQTALGATGLLLAVATAPFTLFGGLLIRNARGRLMWPVALLGLLALLLSAAVVALAYVRWG